jgi:hypothetical protein
MTEEYEDTNCKQFILWMPLVVTQRHHPKAWGTLGDVFLGEFHAFELAPTQANSACEIFLPFCEATRTGLTKILPFSD